MKTSAREAETSEHGILKTETSNSSLVLCKLVLKEDSCFQGHCKGERRPGAQSKLHDGNARTEEAGT